MQRTQTQKGGAPTRTISLSRTLPSLVVLMSPDPLTSLTAGRFLNFSVWGSVSAPPMHTRSACAVAHRQLGPRTRAHTRAHSRWLQLLRRMCDVHLDGALGPEVCADNVGDAERAAEVDLQR